MDSPRGVASLDALILFTALMLVVSVVAAVLINTTQSLVNKDRVVAKEKGRSIQRPIIVESLRGVDLDGDRRLDMLVFAIRMREGDEPVSFNETVVIVNSKAINCTAFSYGRDADENCSYTIDYVKRGPDFEQDRFNVGDLVELKYSGPNIFKGVEDPKAYFIFAPSHGLSTEIRVNIPERIYPPNMGLWPLND